MQLSMDRNTWQRARISDHGRLHGVACEPHVWPVVQVTSAAWRPLVPRQHDAEHEYQLDGMADAPSPNVDVIGGAASTRHPDCNVEGESEKSRSQREFSHSFTGNFNALEESISTGKAESLR
ncbi:hypothetical protein HUJ04_000210 [Dendroctonus ponderosae]|nr:hypothetical protein HUJ04_000210 [Dendroctonus ponderosae]